MSVSIIIGSSGSADQDGNLHLITRGDAIQDVSPTVGEVAVPVDGDTANVYLTDATIENWAYSGGWTKQYSYSAEASTSIADVDGDTSIVPSEGTGGTGGDSIAFTVDGIAAGAVEILAGNIPKWTLNGILDPTLYRPTRLTTANRDATYTPIAVEGDLIYNETTGQYEVYDGVSAWNGLGGGSGIDDVLAVGQELTANREIDGDGFNFGFTTASGVTNSVTSQTPVLWAAQVTDGTNTSSFDVQPNQLVLEADSGVYILQTVPTLDSDLATIQLTGRDSVTGALRSLNRAAFEILHGATDPVDGTTIAWQANQLYVQTTTKLLWRAITASTDPDTNGTGSTFEVLTSSSATEVKEELVPTAPNTIPNLASIPAIPANVKFFINGALDYANQITSDAAGVVAVNVGINTAYGFNIDVTDVISAIYTI